jgi:hypothetical protein
MKRLLHAKKLGAALLVGLIMVLLVYPILSFPLDLRSEPTCTVQKNQTIDLSRCANDARKTVKLDGTWTFYPEQFLSQVGTDDLVNGKPIQVPSVWKEKSWFKASKAPHGYGTYMTTISIPDEWRQKTLAIRLSNVRVANQIIVDSHIIGSSGTPGTTEAEEKAKNKPYLAVFTADHTTIQVAIEVSNFHFILGGIQSSPVIGTYENVAQLSKRNMVFDVAQIAILLTMFIFFIGKSYQRQFNSGYISFAFFCLFLAIPMSFLSERLIYDVIPHFNYELFNRILSSSLEMINVFWILFFSTIIPGIVHRWFKRIMLGFLFSMVILHWVLPLEQSSYLLYVYELGNAVLFMYTFGRLLQFLRKNIEGIGYLLIVSVAAISYSFSFFYNFLFKYTVYQDLPFALPIMVLTMGLYVSRRQLRLIEKLNTTELERLKNQIKPHFIYNALNTIMWMSKRNQGQTYQLLQNFSDYLRGNFNFSEEEKEVSLADEIKLTNAYLELEKARFGEKIAIIWTVQDMDIRIPRLTLQPLVENAIRHGICMNEQGGTITIRISEVNQNVRVEVCDDGPGFTPQQMAKWNGAKVDRTSLGGGIGVLNVHLRLMNLYGVGISIQNNVSGGACVHFQIPRKKDL